MLAVKAHANTTQLERKPVAQNRPQDVKDRAALYIDLSYMTDKPAAQRVYVRSYLRTLLGGIGK